ncbi:dihydrolipoyl dehydrogenase family protein [Alteribacter natronophilus]|uniref:dihydrolipoyl dehydrogenase family protein n=1 Tax=Alteribacter natronophilus TaxID=2583810 RepID=UPI00110F2E53|nr:NAD(P)/FAD-dependent oxidoreductase [Alteribacter natronophilus]TMW71668.1 NAD(P)/FAD-dependent oxidoreductase [Alteribacter natronophilus]
MKKYDLIVIGGGSGGLTAAIGSAQFGAEVALIEKDEEPGGDCLHYGCVPSKTYIKAAKEIYHARRAAGEFGFSLGGKMDFSAVKRRVEAAIGEIQPHDSRERLRSLGIDEYKGFAAFRSRHEVSIDGNETIYGTRIVIATGSRPAIPPIEGLENVPYYTNETIFSLDEIPERLVVIGSGPVGIELAQAMARFGSQVTVVDHSPDLMDREEWEIRDHARRKLSEEIRFIFSAKITKARRDGGELRLTAEDQDNGSEVLVCDALLIAAGRKANVENLNLQHAEVELEDGSIKVNGKMQTTMKNIYACGDVTGTYPFTHAAGMEGKSIVANALFGLRRHTDYTHFPYVIYTDPEVFHLGLTEKQARDQYQDEIHVYKVQGDEVDRFIAERDKDAFVKIITDKKGFILGAHAIGTSAGDWMQQIVFAKHHGHRLKDISSVIQPYPARGEIVSKAADEYWRKRLFSGWIPQVTRKFVKWFR